MNGSNHAAGRRGQGQASRGAPGAAAWPRPSRWTCARPAYNHRRCFLCGERQPQTVFCEEWPRVQAFFAKVERWWHCNYRLGRDVTCKQCCIAVLDGHHCPWWDLCWQG